MEKAEILKDLDEKFSLIKKELKFKSSFSDLNRIFFIKDYVLREGFVSDTLSRGICGRIVETYLSWSNYLHGLIMPNPNYMAGLTESQMFDDSEKGEVMDLISKIMALVSTNTLVGLTKDKKKESWFIDESVRLWDSDVQPRLSKILKKVNEGWKTKG